jgi:8-oxo-dGTP diphosphatase
MEEYNIDVIRTKYQLVPRTLIFIYKDDKILILKKQKKASFGYGKLNGVGGHIERGEEPFESARREICEEAGITVDDLDMAAILFIDINDTPGIQVFVFKTDYKDGEIRESEEGLLSWMTEEDVLNSDETVKDLPFLLDIVKKHKPGKPPVMVKYIYDDDEKLRIAVGSD